MSDIDIKYLQEWVGRERVREDELSPLKVQALLAALDEDVDVQAGDELPACTQWLYFLDSPRASKTGIDGHAHTGGFLPPVPLPRRMWAAGDFDYRSPLRFGEVARQRSVIQSVDLKEGRSGRLIFVGIRHETSQGDSICLVENQTLVYREMPDGPQPPPPGHEAPTQCSWSRSVEPNPVLLFRYSALTFNAHRIHYDRDYATGQEHYPALVVHGPLLATMLARLVVSEYSDQRLMRFRFQALRPAFDNEPILLCGEQRGDEIALWTSGPDGNIGMRATAELET